MSRQTRSWLPAAVVAALAALLIAGLTLLGGGGGTPSPQPGDSTSPTPSTSASSSPTETPPEPSESATPSAHAVAAYYLGDTPMGPRLYREFRPMTGTGPRVDDALGALVATPLDPDYRTSWSPGVFASAAYDGEVVTVTLADPSVRERPSGMDAETARLAVQQVVYTLQAAVEKRAPVQFRTAENPIDQLYGVPTAEPIVNDPPLDTLSLINLTRPEQGQVVTGDTLAVAGVANSFEANVPWEVQDSGGSVVLEGALMATGAYDRLYPFAADLDVSSLPAGEYTFVARTDDPSGGEGPGPMVDSKRFTLR